MWAAILDYAKRLGNSADKTATIHDFAFICGVFMFIVWLNHGIYKGKGFEPGWNQAALTFAGLIGSAKIFGGFSDNGGTNAKKESEQ
jgi:hypothetical protein